MFKSFILLGTIISALLFANHANSDQRGNDYVKKYNQLKNDYNMSKEEPLPDFGPGIRVIRRIPKHEYESSTEESFPDFGPGIRVIRRIPDHEFERLTNNYNQPEKKRFDRDKIIEWFVMGFIIITIMSLPINILWRFRLKIPACLFAIMTALAIIAIPYIYGW